MPIIEDGEEDPLSASFRVDVDDNDSLKSQYHNQHTSTTRMETSNLENKEEIPTLHHLNNSQSQRILWLLEELEINYNLICYERDPKKHMAPPELKAISPMGKSPVLVAPKVGTIFESSAIATYLLRTYDTAGRFSSPDWLRDEILVSFAGATLGSTSAIELLFDLAAKHTPWPLVYVARKIRSSIHDFFTGPEFKKSLEYLQTQLGEEMWFNGKNLGRSDIMLSWPIEVMVQRKWVDLDKEYPKLAAWRMRIFERPAWKRGMEKGNGFDLSSW